jgi:hypothetical protein
MIDLDEIIRNPISRRSFLARMSAAGLGAAAVALLAGCGGGSSHPSGSGGGAAGFADPSNFPGIPGNNEDTVVLNYALTLETLEADLYRQAINIASGKPAGTPAPANNDYSSYSLAVGAGGLSSENAQLGFFYLQQYAGVEAAHRDFLRTALGSAAVPANAKGYTANFGSDMKSIMTLIRTVEETGVTAYLGAAGFLTDANLVQVASTIYSTEARHSSAVNYVLGLDTGPSDAVGGAQPSAGATNEFEYAQTPKAVLAEVKPFFVV